MNFKAVVFDMDGVIADTEPAHNDAWRLALEQRGAIVSMESLDRFVGMNDLLVAETLIAEHRLGVSREALLAEKSMLFDDILEREGLRPMPGVIELWHILRDRNRKVGVATSSERHAARGILSRACDIMEKGLTPETFFSTVVTREDVAVSKPDPAIYRLACSRMGLAPEQCLAVEDSPFGVEAAMRAGLTCIVLDSPYYRRSDYPRAPYFVSSLREIAENGFWGLI